MNRDSLPALIQRSLFFLAGLLSAAGSAADGGHLDTPTVSEALPKASFSCNANLLRNTPDSRFTASEPVSGEPVVSDSATGLTWKKCTQGLSGSGCANGSALAMSWSDAISAANSETFAGFSDWRLPSVQELNSIVETACRPFLNNAFFPDTSTIAGAIHYWTGTTFSLNPTGAYRIDFSAGYLGWDLKTELHYVRLLRGGLAGSQFDAGKDYTPDSFSFAAQTPCVPDRCVATFDRRFLPEESLEAVKGEVERLLAELADEHPGLRCELRDRMVVHPLRTPEDSPLVAGVR